MTGTITRTASKAEEAFTAVMTVQRDFAQRVEDAQIAGDTVAESIATAFGMAETMDAIKKHPEAMDVIVRAAGHKWGFRTDNDTEGKGSNYDKDTLVACFCHAGLQKLKAVGNEFNIISSEVYVTKEGWEGKLERLPGVTEIDIRTGAIKEYDEKEYTTKIRTARDGRTYGGEQKTKLVAYVSATASCKVWGQYVEVCAWNYPDGRDERYQLTGTADIVEAMIDQLRGKAAARIAEQLFKKAVGLSRRGPQEQQPEPARITDAIIVEPVREVVTQEPVKDQWGETRDAVIARLKDPGQIEAFNGLWNAIIVAENEEHLATVADEIKGAKALFSERDVAELRRLYKHRSELLKS